MKKILSFLLFLCAYNLSAKIKVQQGTYFYIVEVVGEDENLFLKSGLIEVLY